jgi:hypothetical protein
MINKLFEAKLINSIDNYDRKCNFTLAILKGMDKHIPKERYIFSIYQEADHDTEMIKR